VTQNTAVIAMNRWPCPPQRNESYIQCSSLHASLFCCSCPSTAWYFHHSTIFDNFQGPSLRVAP